MQFENLFLLSVRDNLRVVTNMQLILYGKADYRICLLAGGHAKQAWTSYLMWQDLLSWDILETRTEWVEENGRQKR